MNEQHSNFKVNEREDSILMQHNSLIQAYSKDLQEIDVDAREYAEKHGIPIDKLTSLLVERLKLFRNRFLSDYPNYYET